MCLCVHPYLEENTHPRDKREFPDESAANNGSADKTCLSPSPRAVLKERTYQECKTLLGDLLKKMDALQEFSRKDLTGSVSGRYSAMIHSLQGVLCEIEDLQVTGAAPVSDIQGVSYIAVRNCELERFSAK
jgi:hypothetical protein